MKSWQGTKQGAVKQQQVWRDLLLTEKAHIQNFILPYKNNYMCAKHLVKHFSKEKRNEGKP
jgi:hypothetical protein